MAEVVSKRVIGGWRQAFVFFAGPVAWALELLIGYALTTVACTSGSKLSFYILAALASIVILAAGLVAYQAWRRLMDINHQSVLDEYDADAGRVHFVAMSGFLISSLFFLLALSTGILNIFLNSCPVISMPFP